MKINLVVGLSQSWMIISVLRHVFCEISTMIVLSFKTCATIENKKVLLLEYSYTILVSLVQFVGIIHNICKVWGSNLDHHKKKKIHTPLEMVALEMLSCNSRAKRKLFSTM